MRWSSVSAFVNWMGQCVTCARPPHTQFHLKSWEIFPSEARAAFSGTLLWTQTCQVACKLVDHFIAFLFYRSSQKFEANTVWPTNLPSGQWGRPWVWKVPKGFVWRIQQQFNYWRRTTHSSWYATHKSCLFIFYSQITARAQKKRFAQLATNVPLTSMGMEYPAGCDSRTERSSTSTRSMQSTSRRRRLMEARRVRTTRSRLWQSRKLCRIPILLFDYIYASWTLTSSNNCKCFQLW